MRQPRSKRPIGLILTTVIAVAWTAAGCDTGPDDATPIGALSGFLDAMNRSADDANALREAYRLLDKPARQALAARARMASSLASREFEPWEMLAQGRFRLNFAPSSRAGMRAEVAGKTAVVVVTGNRKGERARVPMVRERDGWRVQLEIPEMSRRSRNGRGEPQ